MKRIISKIYLTEGLQKLQYEDGSFDFLSGVYAWTDGDNFKELEKTNEVRLKCGIQSETLESGDFLNSMKRNDTSVREMIYWNPINLPNTLNDEDAIKVVNLRDRLFKNKTRELTATFITGNVGYGTEVLQLDNDINLYEFAVETWKEVTEEAIVVVTGKKYDSITTKEYEYRGKQKEQFDETIEGLKKYKFGDIESPPGTGKTILGYRVHKTRKERIKILFSDTINNTTELMFKFHCYSVGEFGTPLKNPLIVYSGSKDDWRVLETRATCLSALDGKNKELKDYLLWLRDCDEESTIICTYKSSFALLRLISSISDFPKMFRIADEVDVISEKNIEDTIAAVHKYKYLFSGGLGMSGTLIRRPNNFKNYNIVYNGDKRHGGPILSVLTESEARRVGQIAEQKVLIFPISKNDKFLELHENRSEIIVKMGRSRITNRDVKIVTNTQFGLIFKALQVVTNRHFKRTHIHLPFNRISDAERAISMIELMQEVGLIHGKYKVINGTHSKKDTCLKDFNEAEFAIIVSTRWILRGTDTVKLDCQILTYVPGHKKIVIQLKGRGHRIHENKDYFLFCFIDWEDNLEDNIIYETINNDSKGYGYDIIGEEVLIEDVNDEINLVPSDGLLDETIRRNEIMLIRGSNSDPEYFGTWNNLVNSISHQEYFDENGESFFKRMADENWKKRIDDYQNKINNYVPTLRIINNFVYLELSKLYEVLELTPQQYHSLSENFIFPNNVKLMSKGGKKN
jgi:superfamily II DNA or RNA helicase